MTEAGFSNITVVPPVLDPPEPAPPKLAPPELDPPEFIPVMPALELGICVAR
jgi:hypothetical protein